MVLVDVIALDMIVSIIATTIAIMIFFNITLIFCNIVDGMRGFLYSALPFRSLDQRFESSREGGMFCNWLKLEESV